jgi:hypothetical protein
LSTTTVFLGTFRRGRSWLEAGIQRRRRKKPRQFQRRKSLRRVVRFFSFGSRSWERCGKSDRDGIKQNYLYYPEGGCVYGKNGYGGAGGGVLLRSYGPISFRKGDIDLRGYNGPSHGGTLKIFHSGIVPSWIYEVGDTTKAKASSDLKQYVGGFYNENLYSGYCADFDTFRVQSLTSVAASYPAGEEKFNLHFEEGKAFVPNGLKVSHGGFEIYRYIDISGSEYFGAETPPPPSNANWTLVATQPYMSTAFLGPQGINNPRNGQVAADSLKRLWTYNAGDENFDPGWYLDETYARPRGLYGTFDFSDDRIYFFLDKSRGKRTMRPCKRCKTYCCQEGNMVQDRASFSGWWGKTLSRLWR